MLAIALDLAKQGYRVFPVKEGRKHPPLIKDWPTRATTNPAQIIQWWTMWAYANVAVCTGDGVVVLDFDCRDGKQGMETYKAWLEQGLLDTLRVITPSNGRHCFFKTDKPLKCSIGTVAPDVDVKGEHGYVVAVGSILSGGLRYVPDHTGKSAASRLPERLYELCLAAEAKASTAKPNVVHIHSDLIDSEVARHRVKMYLVNEAPEAVQGQHGDDTTFKVIQQVRALGVTENVAYELILGYYNDQKCFPAWTAEELRIKVANAYKYVDRSGPIGARNPDIEFEGYLDPSLPTPEPKVKADDDNTEQPNIFAEPKAEDLDGEDARPDDPSWKTLKLLPIGEIGDDEAPPEIPYVIDRVAPRGYVMFLHAETASGKTTIAYQLCISFVTGMPWLGIPVVKGPAFYYGVEDSDVVARRRVIQMAHAYGVKPRELDRLGLTVFTGGAKGAKDMPVLVRMNPKTDTILPTRMFRMLREYAGDVKPVCMVLDPLAMMFWGNENDRGQSYATIFYFTQLAELAGGTVVVPAHPSRLGMATGSGESGSTGWASASRAQMILTRPKDALPNSGLRDLVFRKTQFAELRPPINLIWRNGLYVPLSEEDRQDVEEVARTVFMEILIGELRSNPKLVVSSADPGKRNYAPAVFAKTREAKEQHMSREKLETAMKSLLERKALLSVWEKDTQYKPFERLVLADKTLLDDDDDGSSLFT
jgi:RecA-family ATPase